MRLGTGVGSWVWGPGGKEVGNSLGEVQKSAFDWSGFGLFGFQNRDCGAGNPGLCVRFAPSGYNLASRPHGFHSCD